MRDKLTKEDTRDYFDGIAVEHGVNVGANADKYSAVRSLLRVPETHSSIMECGGGGGFYTGRFLADGYLVTCVDLSGEALQQNEIQAAACGKSAALTTVQGDFSEVAHGIGRVFDQILFVKVLHHFDDFDSIYSALDAALDLCRPGGRIVIFEPNGSNLLWKLFLSLVYDRKTGRTKWYYEQNLRFTKPANLRRFFSEKNVEFELKYHYVIPGFLLQRGFLGCNILRRLNAFLERSFLKRMAFNISITVDMPA